MDAANIANLKHRCSRGRPHRVRRSDDRKPSGPPVASADSEAETEPKDLTTNTALRRSHGVSSPNQVETLKDFHPDTTTPASFKRPSPDADGDVPLNKRNRPDSTLDVLLLAPQSSALSMTPGISSTVLGPKVSATILPARRSTRHTTVQATQMSEGTLRPPGPPIMEAALNIALRNLESETWRYLWAYNRKYPNGPLPTPAAVKEACTRVRRAAEAVDKADRDLEDAIDQIMLSNSKKSRSSARSGRVIGQSGAGASNEFAAPGSISRRSSSLSISEKAQE